MDELEKLKREKLEVERDFATWKRVVSDQRKHERILWTVVCFAFMFSMGAMIWALVKANESVDRIYKVIGEALK